MREMRTISNHAEGRERVLRRRRKRSRGLAGESYTRAIQWGASESLNARRRTYRGSKNGKLELQASVNTTVRRRSKS